LKKGITAETAEIYRIITQIKQIKNTLFLHKRTNIAYNLIILHTIFNFYLKSNIFINKLFRYPKKYINKQKLSNIEIILWKNIKLI